MKKKFTAAERKMLREEEAKILANIDKLPAERRMIAEIAAQNRRVQDAKKAHTPEVGIFFVIDGKVHVDGLPYTEVASIAGLRTYEVGHPNFLRQLQRIGAVPRDLQYDEVPRGRVTYDDKTRTFTLFTDKHVTKRQLGTVANQFNLPSSNTKVKLDNHYRCPKCLKTLSKKQEEEDWNF